MGKTSAQVKNRYNGKTYDRVSLYVRKEHQLPNRLDEAVKQGKAPSRQAYIIDAVLRRLASDGIPVDAEPSASGTQEEW